jgi:hypothetical protein
MAFVKTNTDFFFTDLWLSEPFSRGQAFHDLDSNACYRETVKFFNGNPVTLQRGQIGWSEGIMVKRWQWSRNKVRGFLKWLENNGYLVQQKTRLTTIITICNYEELRNTQFEFEEKKEQQKEQQKEHNIDRVKLLEPQTPKTSYSPREVEYWMAYATEQGFTEERGREFFQWNEERNWTDKAGKTVGDRKSAARGFFRKKRPDAEPIPTRTQQSPTVRTERKGIESPEIVEFFFNNGKNGLDGFQFYAECLAREDITSDNWRTEALKRIRGVAA